MSKEKIFTFAGSIGGQTGSGGGSIGGQSGSGGGSIGGQTGNSNNKNNNSDCIIIESLKAKDSIVYIQKLRNWRDDVLLQFALGKVLVKTYYFISPKLVKLSRRIPVIKKPVAKTAIAIANMI